MNHNRKMSPMSFKSDQKSIPEGSNIDHNSENCPIRDPMRGPSGARKMGPRGVPKSIKNRSSRGPKSIINRSKMGLDSLSVKKSIFGHSEIGPVAIFGGPKFDFKNFKTILAPQKGSPNLCKIDQKSAQNKAHQKNAKKGAKRVDAAPLEPPKT